MPTQVTSKEIRGAGCLKTTSNGLNEPIPLEWFKVVEGQQKS